MRKIRFIVLHCSATKSGQKVTVDTIDLWHKARGFREIGYHFVIYPDGTIAHGRDLEKPGAHVAGNNAKSIGICYVGGLDQNGKPADTRTQAQKDSIIKLLRDLRAEYPGADIVGHRDFSPDLNGDGIIQPWEYMKACPCFDAIQEYWDI